MTLRISFLIFIVAALFQTCSVKSFTDKSKVWSNAEWIAYEQLDDNMKIVPGVHGNGDNLGEKGKRRSVVPLFRKAFTTGKSIRKTTINISGLGHYELYINGDKISDRFLSPGWSYYQKREFYNTYDITEQISEGDNAIGVIVGNGFYNINRERYRKLVIAYGYPKLIFNIRIEYSDGSVENVFSDENCKVAPSPIVFSSIYGGEDYDARLEQKGWNLPGFDDIEWSTPVIVHDTREKLVPERDFPLKVFEKFRPQKIFKSNTGRTIYDFGQNASGIIALKVKGNRGAQIMIRPDELINEEGNVTQRSGGGPYEFNYILKGEGIELWEPRFTYYGFRYADVEIIDTENENTPTEIVELSMLHTRNSALSAGAFQCSDTLFNRIFELIHWGIKSNMASVATDCPHREKLGWLEQTYLIGPSMHYNYDIESFYNKIVYDMMDSQLDNGLVPDIAPEYVPFQGGFRDSPEWGSASIIIPWQLYRWYGDSAVLEKAYPMMTSYVEYLRSMSKNNMLYHGLGDWYDLGPKHPGEAQLTPKAVTATAIYYYDLLIMAKVAELLDEDDDSQKYIDQSNQVKEAFQQAFYDPETGVCSTGSQTAYAMSLYTGILPEQDRDKVFKNLIDAIEANDYALTSGDIGYHFLVRVLNQFGRSDVLYKMNNRTDRPGYGYQLERGATALTESWAALPDVSNNHMMLGHLMEWFYAGLGGIYQDDQSIAYKNIIIAPKPVGDIKWVKCSYHSIRGMIISEWERKSDRFIMKVEIPKSATAKVILPDLFKSSRIEVINSYEQKNVDVRIDKGTFNLEAGRYNISATL